MLKKYGILTQIRSRRSSLPVWTKIAVLGVDKDLKARFLLLLMEMKAAAGFVNGSLAVDITRGVKDTEEQKKIAYFLCYQR